MAVTWDLAPSGAQPDQPIRPWEATVGTLILLALGALLLYITACAVWPFTAHRPCHGTGKRRSPGGKAWRPCRGCAGTGRRVRVGRRVYELFRST